MKIKLMIIAICVVAVGFLIAGFMFFGRTQKTHQQETKALYHCPMHPNFTSDRPGTCGICGMDLVKSESNPEEKLSIDKKKERKLLFYRNPMNPSVTSPTPMKDSMGMDYVPVYEEETGSVSGVAISNYKQQLIGVRKDTAKKRSLATVISTVGRVAHDPDLFVAQEEYVQALKTAVSTQKSAFASIREQSQSLLESSEQKLLHLGMSKTEVEALKIGGEAQENLYFPSHSSKAWVYINVYEYELALVKEEEEVSVEAVAYPGEVFKGKIVALTPILNAESRSVRVRVEVEDKEGKLRPEMFVNAKILVNLGQKLAIPEEAVIDSGIRKIVYVVKDDGRFEAREVTVGPKAGEYYEILSGLKEGEEVVTSGNFLIDSESKLKGAM